MYLLDTIVVSALRRPRPHGAVLKWFDSIADEHLYISAVTIGELQAGIELTRQQDEAKAAAIERWLAEVTSTFSVIPMDDKMFSLWAKLMHRQSVTLYEDAMIAATAIVKNLTVVTRNTRDFEPFSVTVFNPFESE